MAASISASTRCMWIPVCFGVHFGVHFAFFSETWGEGKQDGRLAPWNPRLLRNRRLCVGLFKKNILAVRCLWISDTRPIQCYSMTRVTVWLQCYGSHQFYGAKVLRLQFYWPNVRVPDTTEPRTWLIRQSASLLPPFADVMSPSPFLWNGHTVLPPLTYPSPPASVILSFQVITK